LIPLHEELFQLTKEVNAYDIQSKQSFLLRVFLIIFGNFSVISMLMNMKGVNGISPCCNCKIKAIPIPGNIPSAHYVPLTTDLTGLGRNHVELMADAKRVSGPLHPKRSQCFVARSQRLQQFLTALVPN